MEIFRVLGRRFIFNHRKTPFRATARVTGGSLVYLRQFSKISEDPKTMEFLNYLDSLKNYEKIGVPKGAGTDSNDGFDLGRMRRLMEVLGNPQSKYKVVHIAGTKGKGSTAAFLSSILRSEGYAVGCYTSPHLLTIRERIVVGKQGEPVSVEALDNLYHKKKSVIDQAVSLENGSLSHFEVFTAMAFSLFAEEKVDIAVIEAGLGGGRDATNIISSSELATSIITTVGAEHLAALGGSLESIAEAKSGIIKHGRPVVLGGPFLPHIEKILRDKASSMSSPVISASDPGNRSSIKGLSNFDGKPCQNCDFDIEIEKDIQLFFKLSDVKISMIGSHQLQNAATATCAALCLRQQGLKISDGSIRAGLEQAYLLGRSQFLTSKEAEVLGLPGATILLDGAHTKESSKALVDTIKMTFPGAKLVLVVAMASDKDHLGFAKELLSEKNVEAVFLTEVDIAGDKSRLTSASLLKDCWIGAARELGVDVVDSGAAATDSQKVLEQCVGKREDQTMVTTESSLLTAMKAGNQILKAKDEGNQLGIIVVTGSLHIVASVIRILQG